MPAACMAGALRIRRSIIMIRRRRPGAACWRCSKVHSPELKLCEQDNASLRESYRVAPEALRKAALRTNDQWRIVQKTLLRCQLAADLPLDGGGAVDRLKLIGIAPDGEV